MFWLVHLHDERSFTATSFRLSLGIGSRSAIIDNRRYDIVHFASRSSQFIEKWKRSTAHVFFDIYGHIFFIAGQALSQRINGGTPLKKGSFAYCQLTRDEFIRAVRWEA